MPNPNKDKKLFLFPGSFDPIHAGHIKAGTLGLSPRDLLFFIPIKNNPNKQLQASFYHRCRIINLAIEDLISTGSCLEGQILVKKIKNRKKYNFGLSEIQDISKNYPGYQLFLLIGEDNLINLKYWKNYDQIVKLAPPLVLEHIKKNDKKISSSNLKKDKGFNKHLSLKQIAYINKHNLYQM